MRPSFRFRPNVQCLEDRTCPTVTHLYYNGALFLSGTPSGNLDITGEGGNNFLVQDGASTVGTFALSGNLSISLANHPGAIAIDLNDSTIGGNVLINEGTGLTGAFGPTDIFDSTAAGALSGGQIMGGVSILNGNGAERLDLGGQFNGATLANLPVTVRGNVSIGMKAAANATNKMVVTDGTLVLGSFTATNVGNLAIGDHAGVAANEATVIGGVSITTSGVGQGLTVDLSGKFGSYVSVNGAAATSGSNSFTLETPNTGASTTVAGTLTVTLGSAGVADHFSILNGAGAETTTVSGNTTLSCTSGVSSANETFLIEGNFLQSLNLNLGYNNDLDVTGETNVFGNMNVSAGNGVTDFADPSGNPVHFSANVNGNLTFTFGSGHNNGGAAMVVDGNVGGTLKWTSGNGSDYLKIGSGGNLSYLVNVAFGNADDTFEMDLGAGGVLSGKVDGGGRITANTFIQTSGTTAPTFVMVNFP